MHNAWLLTWMIQMAKLENCVRIFDGSSERWPERMLVLYATCRGLRRCSKRASIIVGEASLIIVQLSRRDPGLSYFWRLCSGCNLKGSCAGWLVWSLVRGQSFGLLVCEEHACTIDAGRGRWISRPETLVTYDVMIQKHVRRAYTSRKREAPCR